MTTFRFETYNVDASTTPLRSIENYRKSRMPKSHMELPLCLTSALLGKLISKDSTCDIACSEPTVVANPPPDYLKIFRYSIKYIFSRVESARTAILRSILHPGFYPLNVNVQTSYQLYAYRIKYKSLLEVTMKFIVCRMCGHTMHRGIYTCRRCGGMSLSSYDTYQNPESIDLWKNLGEFRQRWKRTAASPGVSLLLVCVILTAITGWFAHSNNLLNTNKLAMFNKHEKPNAHDKRKLSYKHR